MLGIHPSVGEMVKPIPTPVLPGKCIRGWNVIFFAIRIGFVKSSLRNSFHIFLDVLVWNFVILMREAVTVGRPVRQVLHLAVQEKCMCTNRTLEFDVVSITDGCIRFIDCVVLYFYFRCVAKRQVCFEHTVHTANSFECGEYITQFLSDDFITRYKTVLSFPSLHSPTLKCIIIIVLFRSYSGS